MSIIYGTLERLEAEQPVNGASPGLAPVARLKVDSSGLPLKLLALALLVVIAGMSLMLWRQGSQVAALLNSISATAVDQGAPAAVKVMDLPVPEAPAERLAAPAAVVVAAAPGADSAAMDSVDPVDPVDPVRPQSAEPAAPEVEVVAAAPVAADSPVAGADTVRAHQPSIAAAEPLPARPVAAAGEASVPAEPVAEPVAPAVKASGSERSAAVENPRSVSAVRDQGGQADVGEPAATVGIDEAIEQARVSLSRGRYQHALSTLERVGSVPDNRPDFWLVKGSAHLGIGQLDQAETAFDAAQALAPYNAQIAVQRAILKQERGDHAAALQILELFADRNPNVPEIFLNQGYSHQALGSTREARRSFRTFLIMTEGRSLYQPQRRVVEAWLAQVSAVGE